MCRLARHIALASLLTITDAAFQTFKRLERLDAWLTNASAPPPTHWRVRSPDDLDNRTDHVLEHGGLKDVWLSQLRDGRRVVVKALRQEEPFKLGGRASDVASSSRASGASRAFRSCSARTRRRRTWCG